jgi:hypothetical protein
MLESEGRAGDSGGRDDRASSPLEEIDERAIRALKHVTGRFLSMSEDIFERSALTAAARTLEEIAEMYFEFPIKKRTLLMRKLLSLSTR